MQIDAFLLAGEGEKFDHYQPLLEKANVTNKAFINIGGKPMIYYILQAINDAETIKSITIVGLQEKDLSFEFKKPVEFIQGGDTTFDSLIAAVNFYSNKPNPPKYVFSVSCDIPLMTAEMVDRFINGIDWTKDKEYYFPVVWEEKLKKHYPNVTKKPFKLKEGKIYGGDLHIFQLSTILGREDKLRDFMVNRKNFFKLVRVISFQNIIRYMLGRLNLDMIEDRIKKIYGLDAAYAIFDFPESCADLDYSGDLEEFNRLCSQPPRKLDPDEKVEIRSQYW